MTRAPSPAASASASPGAGLPVGRGYHALVDLPGGGVLMLGGFNTSPPHGGRLLPETWQFDHDAGWTPFDTTCDFAVCSDGFPGVVGSMRLHEKAATVLLVHDVGGHTYGLDVAAQAWQDMDVEGPPTALGAAMAYDSRSDRMILFGGLDFGPPMSVHSETWAYDLAANAWTKMSPSDAPGEGNFHLMAYDPASDRVILFGGADLSDRAYAETWAYDYESDTWTNLAPDTSPPARFYSDLVYDPGSQRMVMFGGTDRGGLATMSDTWLYDPAANAWTQVDAEGPSVRAWHAMAHDGESGQVVLFGGGERRESYLADTWLFNPAASQWTEWQPEDSGQAEAAVRDFVAAINAGDDERAGGLLADGGMVFEQPVTAATRDDIVADFVCAADIASLIVNGPTVAVDVEFIGTRPDAAGSCDAIGDREHLIIVVREGFVWSIDAGP